MTDRPTWNALEIEAKKNIVATKLLNVATGDYAAARCLSWNYLPSALVAGAQAIEKYLKAFVLLHDPQQPIKKIGHALPDLLEKAQQFAPSLPLAKWKLLTHNFERNYNAVRYPDNPWPESGVEIGMATLDMLGLDELVVFLNENLSCSKSLRYRTGLYAAITFSLGYGASITPTENWIKFNNFALAPLLPRIEQDYHQVIRDLYD